MESQAPREPHLQAGFEKMDRVEKRLVCFGVFLPEGSRLRQPGNLGQRAFVSIQAQAGSFLDFRSSGACSALNWESLLGNINPGLVVALLSLLCPGSFPVPSSA